MTTNPTFTKINIDTLVLVAVWKQPFVFQGCFKIINKANQEKRLLFFRCEANHVKQEAINNDFSPDAYQFTHLYHDTTMSSLSHLDNESELGLYLLKYALDLTLKTMLSRTQKNYAYMDELAMEAIAKNIKPLLNMEAWDGHIEEIGFAAAVDFSPIEETGELAASALLNKFNLIKMN